MGIFPQSLILLRPVLLSAGLIWIMIALVYREHDLGDEVHFSVGHYFLEYSELFFFLLVAMKMNYLRLLTLGRVQKALVIGMQFSFRFKLQWGFFLSHLFY
jgi:hypothetical protein